MVLAPTLTLSAGSGAAIVRPTFSRDFAGEKTLNNGTGPAITFTRASNATFFDASGVLQTASNNEPRFDHDPATGASRGLLIEETRTNLLERSAEFDNAYWTKLRSSVTANSTTAPDGTASADTLVEDTTTNTHSVYRPITHSGAASTVTYSIFAKQKERPRVQFDLIATVGSDSTGVRCTFNLLNGTAGSVLGTQTGTGSPGTGTASITNVGNGWYRCSLTLVPTAGIAPTTNQIYVSTHNGTGASYTGDNTSGLYIWGAQLEAGAFATSYMPTASAAATRSADSAVVTPISGFYNGTEGTIYNEFSVPVLDGASIVRGIVTITNSTFSNRLVAGFRGTGAQFFTLVNNNVEDLNVTGTAGLIVANAVAKSCVAYKSADSARSLNGTTAVAITSAITIPTRERLLLGQSGATVVVNGHIRKVAYYPKRLSNALLQQLTT